MYYVIRLAPATSHHHRLLFSYLFVLKTTQYILIEPTDGLVNISPRV
jgi:hypothetical protein